VVEREIHAAAVAEAQRAAERNAAKTLSMRAARGCVSPLHRRRFALMLLNNHDATQARSVMYVLGPGGAPSPAQMHAQDAADAAGDALEALRSLRS